MAKGRVLVIAGSDSSGGAGLEADQKVISAHGCYAMTATTALTAQNTLGVVDIHHTPPEFVRKLIDACISDIGVDVVKTGMLASAETIKVVANALEYHHVMTTVIDPVMVSTSGSQLLPQNAIRELREDLLPRTTILTPNVPEAKLLLSDAGIAPTDPQDIEDLVKIAKDVQGLGPRYVLLKGGHLPLRKNGSIAKTADERELMVDILYGDEKVTRIETAYLNSKNTHGTGCSLASAIASNLANGLAMVEAVKRACRYVEAGIKTSTDLGQGSGPINHFHSTYTLPFSPDRFIEYVLEHSDVKPAWRKHTEHDFVSGLADGTLPVESFKFYLIQDYLFLIQFARANALAAYKAKTMEDISASAKIVAHIHQEMALHIDYCKGFGITKEEIVSTEESQDMYSTLVNPKTGSHCKLHADPDTKREGNKYWKWIENYVADDYAEAVKIGRALLERNAILQSPSRIEELVQIFVHATNMETGFWTMGAGAGESI
ncbi:hypothetical protein EG329_010810 [Mollisiaceae sp. DMI_Dod_QoI]|nr:hypothetical protein EG329_010810 [Helotiales sp. DMI_Dod_QoI]